MMQEIYTSPPGSGIVKVSGVSREVLPISNGFLLVRYFKMDEEQNTESYFDLYNEKGELFNTVSFKDLEISERITYFISDAESNSIYAAFNEPSPGIIRYRIKFE